MLIPITFKNDSASSKTGKTTPVIERFKNAYSFSKKVGIFEGYGKNCSALSTTISANTDGTFSVKFNKGAIGIYGGIGVIEQGTTLNIPNTISSGSLGVKINLSNPAGTEMQFYAKSLNDALVQDNLQENETSGVYEFEIYKYSISGSVMTLTNGANFNNRIYSNQDYIDILFGKIKNYVVDEQDTAKGWFRIWANGFKETAFTITPDVDSDGLEVELPVEFVDDTYNIHVQTFGRKVTGSTGIGGIAVARFIGNVVSKETKKFKMQCQDTDKYMIYAFGY